MSVIIPYVRDDETRQWSIPDQLMAGVFIEMEKQGLAETVFANGSITNYLQWLNFVQQKENLVHIVGNSTQIEMVAWLNSWGHNYAFGHFCCFKSTWGRNSVELGKLSLDYWFEKIRRPDWGLDVILGQVPATNQRAIDYIGKVGLKEVGTVPMIKYKKDGDAAGAYFCYITREDHKNGREK